VHLVPSAASIGEPAAGAPPRWLAAAHFFQHRDARRQDGVAVAKSLAYQCAPRARLAG
jgi:hypothetical protein